MTARRLVVFVHGFRGKTTGTWGGFVSLDETNEWWAQSDLLFVGYDSTRDTTTGVAARLRREVPKFFPELPSEVAEPKGARPRETFEPYRELILVGHSLGGLVVRRALADAAQEWARTDTAAPLPALLRSSVRLFSPASAGFRAAGLLGALTATPAWLPITLYLRRSPAFGDLQPGSPVLSLTRERTEQLWSEHPDQLQALCARILWANPDELVHTERYTSDWVDETLDGATHSSVCKPRPGFDIPQVFVETGTAW